MPTNNTALFDSVLSAIAASNNAWLFDTASADYSSDANIAEAIAIEVDSLIAPTLVTISQRNLMESIVKGVFNSRQPVNIIPTDYLDIARSIAAIFNEFSTKLKNTSTGNPGAGSVVISVSGFDATTGTQTLCALPTNTIMVNTQLSFISLFDIGSNIQLGTAGQPTHFLDITNPKLASYQNSEIEKITVNEFLRLIVNNTGPNGSGLVIFELELP
jgi:hypothetical protein